MQNQNSPLRTNSVYTASHTADTTIIQLLVPHNTKPFLEWPYFIILGVIFLVSVGFVCLYLPRHWEKRLRSIKYDPAETNNENYSSLKEYAQTSLADHLLHAMPGVFLIIGLSGTFLSLSFVLNGMHVALGEGKTSPEEIQKILSTLGSKFKISIWGIGFNLLYRLPYSWSMNKLNEEIKDTLHHLKKGYATVQEDIGRQTHMFRTSLLSGVTASSRHLGSMDSNFRDFKSVVTKLEVTVTDFGRTITNVAATLDGTTKQFVDTAANFSTTVDRFEKNNTTALYHFTTSIGSFDKNITKAFTEFSDSVTTTLNGISNTIKTATKESSEFIGKTLDELKPVIGKLNEQMEDFKIIISKVEGLIDELFKELKVSNNTNDRLATMLEGNQGAMLEMSDRLNTMIDEFKTNSGVETKGKLLKRVDTILTELSNIRDRLNTTVDKFQTYFGDETRKELLKNVNVISAKLGNMNDHLSSTVDKFQTNPGSEVREKLLKKVDAILTELGNISGQLNKSTNN